MKKKNASLLLMLSLSLGVTACSANKEETQPTSSSASTGTAPAASSASATASPSADPAAKKLDISLFEGVWSAIPDPNGAGIQAINEKFNVNFKANLVPFDQGGQKMAVLMASGDMPDFVGLGGADPSYLKWAKQGAFLPLNDYIDKYPVLQLIPKTAWDSVTVDGNIYAIPRFFTTKYRNVPIIRKDWLDKLNLQMPTTYEELLNVAKAFTFNDPDGNGKDDTYGFVMANGLDNEMAMGSGFYSDTWSMKNDKGQYLPGIITDASKQRIQFLRDAFKAGVVPKDWPVLTYKDNRTTFYSGKAGIYYDGTPGNKGLFDQLLKADPNAVVETIPPFKAPDGSQALPGLSGWYQMYSLNGKLKNDPDKVDRILSMINYFATFIPPEQQNENNPDFDWKNGGVGKGYTMENGVADYPEASLSLRPKSYLEIAEWAPSDEALQVEKKAINPIQKAYAEKSVKLWSTPGMTYINPVFSIHSDLYDTKFWELNTKLIDEQTKMIVGNTSMDNWDKMVQDFLKNGGQDVIDEVNQKMQEAGAEPVYK
ncbi:putative aldouronate transport system substrate-binding protein [Cohnella sp. OV330]|uniref:extracellular solute-binding protein n=1 Tax=Cohnella sp. OV330 TaxID=1855288 RepID=UPI0008E71A9D|nr:extracellular solute-binding protein [Cohnella sp. OV330]SFB49605.1 putative aldouronate transport system substrate-binding protein [Cohnella sp. OV330]